MYIRRKLALRKSHFLVELAAAQKPLNIDIYIDIYVK